MKKNPEDYYIWRTKKDDKVRGKHAEREGKIFNWHVPPEGGHPGEEHNCRCWADPYKPEKYNDKQMIVDLGGLYAENEATPHKLVPVPARKPLPEKSTVEDIIHRSVLEKSPNVQFNLPWFNNDDGYTTEVGNMMTDVPIEFVKNAENSILSDDSKLLELMAYNLLDTEKMKNYIYLDKFGHITAGVGALLDDEEEFKSVPWMINGRLATEEEVDATYQMFVYKRFEKDSNGKFKNHNRLAESFKDECSLRISKEFMIQKMMNHLASDLRRVRLKMKDFDMYPLPLKLIILDFYYNKGSFYNQPGLPQALNAKDAKLFQEKMIRHMDDRDKWTKEQFSLIPKGFWKTY